MIRVIGGQVKGRKLFGPAGQRFRPVTGIVKEFIFSYLQFQIKNAVVLDLFAGSGAVGIEALSRGAFFVYFIDRSKYSINILKKNLEICNFTQKGSIIQGNVFSQLPRLGEKGHTFDLIFADPPLHHNLRAKIVTYVDTYGLLKNKGVLIVKHKKMDYDESKHTIEMVKQKNFGINVLSVYI